MARLIEMGTLIELCQQRADKENDDHIANTEWRTLIDESYGELFEAVAETGLRYFEKVGTLTSDGTAYVAEPTDVMSTIGLDYVLSTGERRPLREIMIHERAKWAGRTGSYAVEFAMIDDRIYLYPTPPSGQTYELLYVYQPPDLGAFDDDDCVDVVVPSGRAFIVWDVAIKASAKSETDAQLAMVERDAAKKRVVEWAVKRMLTQPRRQSVEDESALPISPGDWRFR